MRLLPLVLCVSLASCAIPTSMKGSVHELTEHTVTIRGAFDMSPGAGAARPSLAMIAQAQDLCPGAEYLSATPSNIHKYDYTFLYLFRCPNGPK